MAGPTEQPFDIAMPDLPTGRVTLEASAGTGKTYTIVGLATRYVAEGRCTAEQLLVVTFARSATRELRQRLLERLARGLDVVTAALQGHPPGDDAVDRALCDADPQELARRRDRLADALADIDSATVCTIHTFCADALHRMGDVGLGELLEDESAFAVEIAGDLYLRAAAESPADVGNLPYFDFNAPDIARAGLSTDPADVIPQPPDLGSWTTVRSWLAVQTHEEAQRRRRRMGVHTYDDLLARLAGRLTDHVHGAAVAARCGGRFTVGLVDEFQDTDPVQWQIFSSLFPDPSGTDGRVLVMVGDPKQAIYGFRGADVNAYVRARGATAAWTLTTNRRSDRPVVDATLALFTDRSMGTAISLPHVDAHHGQRLAGIDVPPVLFRMVPEDAPVRRTEKGGMGIAGLRDLVAADVARQAAEVLCSDATIDGRPVGPQDIAVLVRTRRQAAMVQRHLVDAGIPSVVNGVGNVMASRGAREWAHLLRALDRPSHAGQARLAAMTDLLGWTPADVASADEDAWDTLHVALHRWRRVLLSEGVAAAFRHIGADTRLAERLLAHTDGDRRLTDLGHLAELLHAHSARDVGGTAGLVSWIESSMAQAADTTVPTPPEHLATRLERAGDVVQILTVHGAKGLQFGIVLAPFLWDSVSRTTPAMRVHDPGEDRRRLYVGVEKRSPDHQYFTDLYRQQSEEEERRLAYVAATRAKHHLRLWWAPSSGVAESPLGTLLARPRQVHTTEQAVAAVEDLIDRHGQLFGCSTVLADAPVPTLPTVDTSGTRLQLARLGRTIDAGWRRTSYSRLVGGAASAADAVANGDTDVDTSSAAGLAETDPEEPVMATAPPDPALDAPVPLADMRGGADVGTALHAVLEHVDFTGTDLPERLLAEVQRQTDRHAVDLGDAAALADVAAGLDAAIRTPLDAGGTACLADIGREARLDEMAFELPILSEARSEQADRVLISDIADLLDTHLDDDDPLAGYADVLRAHLPDVEMRGFLAGFVDLIARVPGTDAYLVADYKTNRIAPAGTEVLTVGHFTARSMAAEMISHHYPLQALIYQVALHRYLRWRLPGYDPAVNLAGIAYLFLRGMVGPDTPVRDGMPCGVFRWRPPTSLLHALDQLFTDGLDRP